MRAAKAILAAIALVSAAGARAINYNESDLARLTTLSPEERDRREAEVAAMSPAARGEAMVAAVKDRTIMYYQPGHGVYIEFTRADGRLFMWYPGNRKVVFGVWGLRNDPGPQLCYKYLKAYNGVTGEFESTECIPPLQALVREDVIDSREGDPYNLASGKLPYSKAMFDVPDWP